MALTHVCVWDSQLGFRRITAEEARKLFPYGTSARSGHFVCELCAQNVLFTKPGDNIQHFRHDPSAPNKECDERQLYFDPSYGRNVRSLNSHAMPIRINVTNATFNLQIGFFYPPNVRARCQKIRIAGNSHRVYEYSFERIERFGTTYLNIGQIPSEEYYFSYENATPELKNYWAEKTQGIPKSGALFDGRTGKMIQSGGKAYADNEYYLLQKQILYSNIYDLEIVELTSIQDEDYSMWHLYKVRAKRFSESSAKFFLKYAIFLTELPTKFYPIWPVYIQDPYLIYHNANDFFFYLCGDDAELKAFPDPTSIIDTEDGRVYKICTQSREQLVSLGKSGALGFSYIVRQPLQKTASRPSVTVSDIMGNELSDESYSILPKSKLIRILSQYDGKAVVKKHEKTVYIHKLHAEQPLTIDKLTFGIEIAIYQGSDLIRTIRLDRQDSKADIGEMDRNLVKKLYACSGPLIPISHSIGTLANKYAA